jgi:hypothetical protein
MCLSLLAKGINLAADFSCFTVYILNIFLPYANVSAGLAKMQLVEIAFLYNDLGIIESIEHIISCYYLQEETKCK